MNSKQRLILELLATSAREMFGLELVEASGGKLQRGTIYVYLQRLEEAGLITSRLEPGSVPLVSVRRRLYKITEDGRRSL